MTDSTADCGQRGALLPAVLGVLLFFAVTVVAILGFTLTLLRATADQATASSGRRSSDAAMEMVISRVRADPTGALGSGTSGSTCAGLSSTYDVQLPPTSRPGASPTNLRVDCTSRASGGNRIVELSARLGGPSGEIVGRSLVRLTDTPTFGYRVTVCDWKLGDVGGTLAPCP